MDIDSFKRSLGRVEVSGTGYFFFVPPSLPRTVVLNNDLATQLSKADHELGRLCSFGEILPNPQLLIRPYLIREAVLSSKIEGTQATVSEVLLREADTRRPASMDVKEVRNYMASQNEGQIAIRTRPIDLNLIRQLHKKLLTGVRGQEKHPGEFRRHQNWIGPEGCEIEDAYYVPPSPAAMRGCLVDFEKFLQNPPEMPPLIQAALLHYQFEAIHPFRDGNGRIGRLLIMLWLLKKNSLTVPLLYLSAFFERNRSKYYELLLKVSQEGSAEEWVSFFLEGVSSQAADAVKRSKRLLSLREEYRQALTERKATAAAFGALDHLFEAPYCTIPMVAKRLQIHYPTAKLAVKYLMDTGIVLEEPRASHPQVFRAPNILKAIEGRRP